MRSTGWRPDGERLLPGPGSTRSAPAVERPAEVDSGAPKRGEHWMLRIQRQAGNAAVARQRAGTGPATGVHAGRFANAGTSLLGHPLGLVPANTFFLNWVTIVFDLDPGVSARYTDLQARQWSGPEAVYFKTGPPVGSPWQTMRRGGGSGRDDPLPEFQRVTSTAVAYDDSPGVSVAGHLGHTWVHVVQNFTGWVEGRPRAGGGDRRLTEVVSWHSVISLVNSEAGSGGGSYEPTAPTRSGTGWAPLDHPPL